jgi:hypothetical protein
MYGNKFLKFPIYFSKSNTLFSGTGGSALWLPPPAFTPRLDPKYDRSRPGGASLATTIAEPKTRPYFLTGICKGLCLSTASATGTA